MRLPPTLRNTAGISAALCLGLLAACQPTSTELESQDRQTHAPSIPAEGVAFRAKLLWVDGKPFDIKGICWNPVPKGGTHPEDLAFVTESPAYDLDFIERDLQLISEAGFNTLRPYKVITDTHVLERIEAHGLKVIAPVFNYHATPLAHVKEAVTQLENHPTTLFWEIGNEWNYNHFYDPNGSYQQSVARIHEVISLIRSLDTQLPIATNYGEIPTRELVNDLDLDFWGLNIYRSDDFGNAFESWMKVSDKPIYIGEYGADAIDNRRGDGRYAPAAQAHAVEKLTQQIIAQYVSLGKGPALGGALFEFSDEWWKDGSGSPDQHDIGGIAPGGGPYPDLEFNEEWWGIVDIDRAPRPAYHSIKAIYNP